MSAAGFIAAVGWQVESVTPRDPALDLLEPKAVKE
jgi:hypothetical protein